MIEISDIYTENDGDIIYIKADCILNGKEETIWYSTSIENEKYISLSNADAFILILFIYAVFNNYKLSSEVAISSRLKYGLLEILLPAYQMMGYDSKKEDFNFPLEDDSKFEEAKAVGTAMSFGVDSFYTYLNSLSSDLPVDTLTLFNAGAYGQEGGDKARKLFNVFKLKVNQLSEEFNLNFFWVNTNINELLPLKFVQTHTFRNLSCVLLFQKYFKAYYYASGIDLSFFKLNHLDPAYFDLLNSKAIASNSLEFIISGLFERRLDKTIFISDQDKTYKRLNVCLVTPDNYLQEVDSVSQKIINCSKCFKCIRTMVTLDVLGKLEEYKEVFDLNLYYQNKNIYWADLLYRKIRMKDVLAVEIFDEIKKRMIKVPFIVYIEFTKLCAVRILKKLKK